MVTTISYHLGHVIRKYLVGGVREADSRASASVGPSVATQLAVSSISYKWCPTNSLFPWYVAMIFDCCGIIKQKAD